MEDRPAQLPPSIRRLVDDLVASDGVEAVVLGGSRATGDQRPGSDWDIGVHYRGDVDLHAVATRGVVHPPGSWGRLMNGGAWLDLDGIRVDVLLRDLDIVEHWWREAQRGRYEVDGLLGYVAGIPTYSLVAELAIARPLRGDVRLDVAFPDALREAAPTRWRFHRDFSLTYASAHADRENVIGVLGQLARAVLEEAHARQCERGSWVLNEKRLLDGCGLERASVLLRAGSWSDAGRLRDVIASVSELLRSPPSR